MYYTVYKITNKINNKIYIGVHKTLDLIDSYMGSGKLIKYAIDKYGIENFNKEYLAVFDNPEEMFKMESELVNEEFINSPNSYNIKERGYGGWDHLNKGILFEKRTQLDNLRNWIISGNKALQIKLENDLEFKQNFVDSIKRGLKRKGKIESNRFKGKTHTVESKQKISKANSVTSKGERNSQYGTYWICNIELMENRKIKKDEELPSGWILGRNKWKIS